MPCRRTVVACTLALVLLAVATPAKAQVDALVGALTSQLDVTEEQATGGAGALFALAEERMAPSEFSRVSSAVPGVDQLLGAAPALGGGSSGPLGEAASALGGSDLGQLAQLAGPFAKLGLSPDMISRFLPVVLDYVQSTGGEQVMGLVQNALLGA